LSNEIPNRPNFEELKRLIPAERKAIIKVHDVSDESMVRIEEDANLLMDFIANFQNKVFDLLEEIPSLVTIFSNDFIPIQEFVASDYIFDICFLDDCLFPSEDKFYFGPEGVIEEGVLNLHLKEIETWIQDKKQIHLDTQKFIREEFDSKVKLKELGCRCTQCVADYRSQQRDSLFDECTEYLENYYERLEKMIDDDPGACPSLFKEMKSHIDQAIRSRRHQLRRGTLNRLETQVKNRMRDRFCFPAQLATSYSTHLIPDLKLTLKEKDYSDDLINDLDLEKFFKQLRTNIWRNRTYLYNEFFKFFKSVMILKRKDISSTILNTYLGEFWTHSNSRQLKRKIVYHMGPTNSGKTYHSIQELCKVESGCYLAPLRLLAGELYDRMNSMGAVTTLLTGEEVVEKDNATHISSTIEMARFQKIFDVVVIDEIQMIKDPQRGWAWTRALVNIFSPVIHVCGDHTAYDLVKEIADLCGDELEVRQYERLTKLEVEKEKIYLDQLQKGDALIVFSRRNALRYKHELGKLGFRVSIVYGRLSPEVRREQARKFDEGETDIIVSTDAIAMGMNLPIRRIVFSTVTKFINGENFQISNSEIKQIAGRAGRYGRFPTGYVTTLHRVDNGLDIIQTALDDDLEQSEQSMVGPDLDIFTQVNSELQRNSLHGLKLSEFLRLFYTMDFKDPFYCVELNEMIELAEMVEEADKKGVLSSAEIFGFSCAPVNMGLIEHVQFFLVIVNNFVHGKPIHFEPIDATSRDIDYLETSIKCMELYQWLSRHFNDKHFDYDIHALLHNKGQAVDQLNELLSNKWVGSQFSKQFSPRHKGGKGGYRKGKPSFKKGSGGGGKKKSGGKKKFSYKRRKSSSGKGKKR
jgi:ATP-dependent RNA helicase SUPV3L1/SUV3